MLRLAIFALSALRLFAQDDLVPAAKNPYDLARYLDSHTNVAWEQVWKALGVAKPPEAPNCEEDGAFRCSVRVITIPRPSQAILAINGFPVDLYIRFLQQGSGWRYAGSDAELKKNHAGRYEISQVDGKPFLRVSGQGANGSDWDSEIETWFDLSLPDFNPVFGFTVQGGESRVLGVSRSVLANAEEGAEGVINVVVEIRFSMGHELDLGSAQYVATYARNSGQKKFSLKGVKPYLPDGLAISNREFELLANIDVDRSPPTERLLVFTLPRLKEIATGSSADAKDWLRAVLAACKDTPEKRVLQSLLDRKR